MTLTRYWFDHQHPDLFSWAHSQQVESKSAHAVIDANVVYTLYENPDHPIFADWLLDDVFLCVTPEMKNEINRNENAAGRKLMWNYVSRLAALSLKSILIDKYLMYRMNLSKIILH